MKLLIFHSKHDDPIYDVSTPELRALAFTMQVMDNAAAGWYYAPSRPVSDYLTQQQINALPTEKLREVAERDKRNQDRELSEYQKDLTQWEAVQAILAAGSIAAAARLPGGTYGRREICLAEWVCQARDAYEYESFEETETRSVT